MLYNKTVIMNQERNGFKMEINLTSGAYEKVVADAKGVVLIDFWATWCGPCKMIAPVIAEIAEERPDITVCKVNVDDDPALAARFSVKYIPTLAVIKDGKLLVSASGYRDKAGVLKLIEDAVK